jgi:HD-GYP domain-containing protein (c-di-GMP phosphodiesterase class II)
MHTAHPEIEQALQALQAALFGGEFYDPEHPAVKEPLLRARDHFARAAYEYSGPMTVLWAGARLVCEGQTLHDPRGLMSGLFERLRQAGADGLTFHPGVEIKDLRQLLRWLHVCRQTPRPWGGTATLRPARLAEQASPTRADAPNNPNPPGPMPAAPAYSPQKPLFAPDQLEQIWSSVATGEQPPDAIIDAIIEILCNAAQASQALLPLAQMKSFDEYTYTHTVNVAMLAAALAEAIGFSPRQISELTLAAVMHDIGKRLIPVSILNKPGKLTPEQCEIMKRHPVDGARILLATPGMPDIAPIVAFEHHMYLDGSGYPLHQAHTNPHLCSQIVQIADVFDALCTNRPYRPAMPIEQAAEYLDTMAGRLLQPQLTALFLQHVTPRTRNNDHAQAA